MEKPLSTPLIYRVHVTTCLNFSDITSAELTMHLSYAMRKEHTVNFFYICTLFLYNCVTSPLLSLEFILLLISSCTFTAVQFLNP